MGAGAPGRRIAAPAPVDVIETVADRWWEGRWFAILLIVAAMVPLLYPPIPPLVDVPGHIGRFRLLVGGSPFLDQFYSVHWRPIGNLGVDLLALPLASLAGIEAATKWVVLAIPALTVAGMLWVAREAHGRLPPTAAFAVPLAYAQPFLFGFANFALSMGLALLAFALWLRLARKGHLRLRAAVMIPFSFILYFAHVYGWGFLGLLAFCAEVIRQYDAGRGRVVALAHAALHASALALPILFMLLWRGDLPLLTKGWFDLPQKAYFLASTFRDRWMWLDLASLFAIIALFMFARDERRLSWSRGLLGAGLLLGLVFLLLPSWLFGSAYADMRLAPFVLMVLVLAIGLEPTSDARFANRVALCAVVFMAVRLGATAASLATAAQQQQAQLAALDHVPQRSRVAVLVDHRCDDWALPRNDHLGSLALARRESFVNDQWALEGGTLIAVHYPAARGFDSDDSQLVFGGDCGTGRTLADAIEALPGDAFDALWLVDADLAAPPAGWVLRWTGGGSQLYLKSR